ncbi:hypothetical protein QR680_007432 [Steinernema hermaphroditum]|uniref:G-patch domain-containing protein n=1 Tax=Steinernema hermaphroditum TaxID=289476 RepID=A0AA39M5Z1_9BILA|nr:hypothetical protein QR680_007432 [Steinernema hermaphroditum]
MWGESENSEESSQHAGHSDGISVADMVKEAASTFYMDTVLPGYVLDEASGMYYNATTGYYYDPKSSMYYNVAAQSWYSYNARTGTYTAHKHFRAGEWSKKRFRRRAMCLFGCQAVESAFDQNNVDICELLFGLVDECVPSKKGRRRTFFERFKENDDDLPVLHDAQFGQEMTAEETYFESDDSCSSDDEAVARESERQEFPPCIRLVQFSDGNPTLHIVTVMGATVGSGDCDVKVEPDENYIGGLHISLKYENETDDVASHGYTLECCSKWALLNGQYIEGGLDERYRLNHGDEFNIGNHRFIVHIHHGSNTCQGCEPGLLAAIESKEVNVPQTKRSSESQRLENIRRMKSTYGLNLKESDYRTQKNYSDRARQRREIVGSDSPTTSSNGSGIYKNCSARPTINGHTESVVLRSQPPKIQEPLTVENKGFKLLKGMGWKEGTGLGKNEQGMLGPVSSEIRKDRAGLGTTVTSDAPLSKKQRLLDVTRRRFEEASAKDIRQG